MAHLYTNLREGIKDRPRTDRAEEKDAFAIKATNPAWRPICPYLPCRRNSRLLYKEFNGSFSCVVCRTRILPNGTITNCPDRSQND